MAIDKHTQKTPRVDQAPQAANFLLEQVRSLMCAYAGKSGVVAVSGGPDSTALAHAVVCVHAGPVILAHMNHQLRGPDSDADEAIVAEFATKLGENRRVGFRSCRVDVAAEARKCESVESTGRRLRYAWLAQIAHASGATWVATGHTADDQAETVLHRILRGSGLHGLSGIPARRPLDAATPDVQVIRPLLHVRRADVLAYIEEHKLPYRQDQSNSQMDYTRNRIRHDLLPKLVEQYNPAIVSILCRLAEQASAASSILAEQAAQLLTAAELPRAGAQLIFAAARLANAPQHLVREMFRLVWQRENWPASGMTFDDWTRLSNLVEQGDGRFDLPGPVNVRRRGAVIQIGHDPR